MQRHHQEAALGIPPEGTELFCSGSWVGVPFICERNVSRLKVRLETCEAERWPLNFTCESCYVKTLVRRVEGGRLCCGCLPRTAL